MKRIDLLLTLALAADFVNTTCDALGLTHAAYSSEYIAHALTLQAIYLDRTNRPNNHDDDNDDNDHDEEEEDTQD